MLPKDLNCLFVGAIGPWEKVGSVRWTDSHLFLAVSVDQGFSPQHCWHWGQDHSLLWDTVLFIAAALACTL